MDEITQLKEAKSFAERWSGRGYEKGDTQAFWVDLLNKVLGMTDAVEKCKFEYRASNGGFIDAYIPDCGVLIEQKGIDINLDKAEVRQGRPVTPFQQALAYAQGFKRINQPRFIVVCNFKTFRVYDWNKFDVNELEEHAFEFTLEELSEHPEYLAFITDPENSRSEKEKQISFQAGKQIGEIYEELKKRFIDPDSDETQHALNVLCVRLVFCLFCEDTKDVFPNDIFLNYLKEVSPEKMRVELKRLFKALDTPIDQRDPYDETIKNFPYVGGGLFSEDTEIPNFDENLKYKLLYEVSQKTDWSKISPTIFGGIFEGTLNPETRHAGGMHYTSPENIHKVIEPLFLDDLHERFSKIMTNGTQSEKSRNNELKDLHKEICSLTFFDPACGSGNFLTETFLCLKRLEDDILRVLYAGQTIMNFSEDVSSDRVSLKQFFGIEVNDFAVRVARVALFIAQLQSNVETEILLDINPHNFPLTDSATIVHGNALRLDWNDVLPANKCNYIIGNPPFIGYSNHSKEQGEDRALLFGKVKTVDYVACWYKKAAEYMNPHCHSERNECDSTSEVEESHVKENQSSNLLPTNQRSFDSAHFVRSAQDDKQVRCAFVSTNSICQGQQVQPIWQPLFEDGIHINFAHKSFIWNNEATDGAHVHVVVIGFSYEKTTPELLFQDGVAQEVENINGYLANAGNVFVENRTKPLCNTPNMSAGFKPADNGNLLLSQKEYEELLQKEPNAKKWIRPFSGGDEFINGVSRYCLWLKDIIGAELKSLPEIRKRIDSCKEWRSQQTKTGDAYKLKDMPHLLRPCNKFEDTTWIAVPETSSERRKYIPLGFIDNGMIPSNALRFIPTESLFIFGILNSQSHNAWMRILAGRLESRYRYASGIVYNNFPWPGVTKETLEVPVEECVNEDARTKIEACAQDVLDARDFYVKQAEDAGQTCSLADMYDPNNDFLYPKLTQAHARLDKAVEGAYGVNFGGDEEKIVAHLFGLYETLTN